MKKNKGNKTKIKSLKESIEKGKSFYNSGFEHITGKYLCLKCNKVESNKFNHCNVESYYLGKVVRTPKKNDNRSKWKKFYKFLDYKLLDFKKENEYKNIVKKYKLTQREI